MYAVTCHITVSFFFFFFKYLTIIPTNRITARAISNTVLTSWYFMSPSPLCFYERFICLLFIYLFIHCTSTCIPHGRSLALFVFHIFILFNDLVCHLLKGLNKLKSVCVPLTLNYLLHILWVKGSVCLGMYVCDSACV